MKIGSLEFTEDHDETPGRFILYGSGGVGKTTLAATAPKPILVSVEDGAREFRIPTAKFDEFGRKSPKSFEEVHSALNTIAVGDVGDRKTLIVDACHELDQLIAAKVLRDNPKWKSIQEAGFGKGEAEVLVKWRQIVALLEEINRKKRLRIVLTLHSQPVKFKDPEGPEFDRFDMAVTKHNKGDVAGFLFGWADVVGFTRFEKLTQDIGSDQRKRTVAVAAQGDRIMHLGWTNAYQAKCRLSGAPEQVKLTHDDGSPKTWSEVFDFEDKSPALMREEIGRLLAAEPEEKRKKFETWLAKTGDDIPALSRALEKLRNEKAVNKEEEKAA